LKTAARCMYLLPLWTPVRWPIITFLNNLIALS
jgi:hypothetical protein